MRLGCARAGLLGWLVACALGCYADEGRGEPTGSLCDPTLSYGDDVAPIVDHYCVSCHSESLPLSSRHGAPGDRDFDTEGEVLANALRIQRRAGVGPDAQNRSMPPKGFRQPSDDDRVVLSRFLACEIERDAGPSEHPH